jgi:rhamnogalacturonyl hydrolase YesR
MRNLLNILLFICIFASSANAQQIQTVSDATTPLHLQKPEYNVDYKVWGKEEIKSLLNRILDFIEKSTPTIVIDKLSNTEITDYSKINDNSILLTGNFRLTSYEWGVTYSSMIETFESTGDMRFFNYVLERLGFIDKISPYFKQNAGNTEKLDPQIRKVLFPASLDDSGAICAAIAKLQIKDKNLNFSKLSDRYINYIMNKQYRLKDGTFARNRPQNNTLWLDDMYMSIPAIVWTGRLTGDSKYYDEAIRQIELFSSRMFLKNKGLFMHGWVEGEEFHPAFHWGRANGWALLALTETLDALPSDYPGRESVLKLYKSHVQSISALQSGEGFWHQLLDRPDSYLETSATAIFTYCIARGINKGWLDVISFGPVAFLGWSAVASKINTQGQVEGVCVGTGMAFDPAFYYYRPVNVWAAHGYGTTILAGAEIYRLIGNYYPYMNDSSIQFYKRPVASKAPIFDLE